MNLEGKTVLITGGRGFLGRHLREACRQRGVKAVAVSSADGDLRHRGECMAVIRQYQPDVIIHAAAKVGGIGANAATPATFLYDNALMGLHLLYAASELKPKIVMIGTVCSYPAFCPTPFREEFLWAGAPEATNAPYGVAKRMLITYAQACREQYGMSIVTVIPSNLYGPGDKTDLATSHVIPAIIRKCLEAVKENRDTVELWGTGTATRDFLYVDDAVSGILAAAEHYDEPEPLNLGTGQEITIAELATEIAQLTGFHGLIKWNTARPNGQERRAVSAERAMRLLGWAPRTSFQDGLQRTVDWYRTRG